MKMQKLIRQFGEHGNEYSPIEMGDKINEIIDALIQISDGGDNPFKGGEKHQPEPLLEPLQSTIEPKVENSTPIAVKPEGVAVRSQSTQDMVYLIKDGKKHWIKNPETLRKLGFDFHKVKNITNQEMTSYEAGKPIDLKEKPIAVQKTQNEFDKYNI